VSLDGGLDLVFCCFEGKEKGKKKKKKKKKKERSTLGLGVLIFVGC
jgi:hypothetical protein